MRHIITVLLLSLALLTACAGSAPDTDDGPLRESAANPAPPGPDSPPRTRDSAATQDPESSTEMPASAGETSEKFTTSSDHQGDSTGTASRSATRSETVQPRIDLKAGEVDDNARWDEYLRFIEDYQGPRVHTTNLRDRWIIIVLDRNGRPVPNARVTVSEVDELAGSLTYADGRTLIFPEALRDQWMHRTGKSTIDSTRPEGALDTPPRLIVRVEREGFTATKSILLGGDAAHTISLEGTMTYSSRVPLDVLFLVDSTGSMADEIHQIKTTLQSIAQRVSDLPSKPDLQFGMLTYRDRGDDYVTRLYDFDGNVERFQQTIRNVSAEGGGDYPESLNQALHEAVNHASWREDSIRLTFLIADAPPHLDYEQDEDYAVAMVKAREQGIKIFSVASSGLDEQGEYIFRQIAQQTMGRFLFILYREGPQSRLDTPHSVEQFTVNNLDGLIVRLIEIELAGMGGGEQTKMRMK